MAHRRTSCGPTSLNATDRRRGDTRPPTDQGGKQRIDGALMGSCAGLAVALGITVLAVAAHHLEPGTRIWIVAGFMATGGVTGFCYGATRLENIARRRWHRRR
jgi:hypothetical protein